MKTSGFTIIEILVGMAIFLVVAGASAGLLVSGLSSQQFSLSNQTVSTQTSFLGEYMTRVIRQASKELGAPPTCVTTGTGENYMVTNSDSTLTFVDKDGACHVFSKNGGKIQETVGGGATQDLTAADVTVNVLFFEIAGESQTDNIQPRVKLYIELEGEGDTPPKIPFQTTVSQRRYDVEN
ncbi:MAG: prepilin-type N-terminal cleavage/methylation domain-containing protein [archaeon]|nr:prepilin-type N-terminal cleavage/methylation domain-containing protein [archaeon]